MRCNVDLLTERNAEVSNGFLQKNRKMSPKEVTFIPFCLVQVQSTMNSSGDYFYQKDCLFCMTGLL